ncbi:hypothetical protein K431DRAFT_282561 [Polychaeton citri CBS 116435]|uniref:Tautomerase cis-CaaD-like domain-containing protein n=1 Tax=Polychaeton citri CBS 116435 TaxID=1314669 RepID=A0A9P4URG1_9PEZI|nr:hypothetical protein K431DRAFT_282561 [Polychaeton citri CBS 116435]
MPLYEVHHICPLSINQQDEFAEAITTIHSNKFTTPKLFVNIVFHDESSNPDATPYYVGGKRRPINRICASVRTGPSRTQKDWDSLSAEILGAWNRTVRGGPDGAGAPLHPFKRGQDRPDVELRVVFVTGSILGGIEAGFRIPAAGEDVTWLQKNWEGFVKKAQAGDEDFKELVREVEERGLMRPGDGKTEQQRLEELLGWGDSA